MVMKTRTGIETIYPIFNLCRTIFDQEYFYLK